MVVMKVLSIVVPLLAIVIGGINTFKPSLWLKIPHVGFIPWAIGGGEMPPFFFFDAWKPETFGTWIKNGDVVAASGAKMGTHWLLYTCHMIRTKGTDNPPWEDVNLNTPWPSTRHFPDQKWERQQERMNSTILKDGTALKDKWDHPSYPFRVFKSHEMPLKEGGLPAECLPIREFPKVKWLVMFRPGRDVINSFYTFFTSHTDELKNTWGGFPPNYQKHSEVIDDLVPGGKLYSLFFGYVRAWWPWRHEPNVLMLHYNNYKKDHRGTVKRISEFIEYPLTDKELDKVAEMVTFEKMKARNDLFRAVLWDHPNEIAFMKTEKQGGEFFKTGKAGAGKFVMNAELEASWQAAMDAEISDPELARFIDHGGEFS